MDGQGRLVARGVIVTGATSGIGRAIALRCVREGGRVLGVGRREDALAELVSASGGAVQAYRADLAEPDAADGVVAAAIERFGRVDGLVHSAGTVWRGEDIRTTSDAEYAAFLDENLTSTFRVVRAVFRQMATAGSGSIVLLGSQLAHIAVPGYSTYSTVKGGITALGRALAVDGGPLGIRVNVVAPGVVLTPMAYVDRPNFDDLAPSVAERHPLRRLGQPDDIAGPAAFLLSDDAAWVTGHTLVVDGGFTIQ